MEHAWQLDVVPKVQGGRGVDGVGKGSVREKYVELLNTGKMEKLEEQRMNPKVMAQLAWHLASRSLTVCS